MAALKFENHEELEAWLREQKREVAIIIAARAALRVLPLVVEAAPKRANAKQTQTFLQLTASTLRATALARVAAKYPTRADQFYAYASQADTAAYSAYLVVSKSGDYRSFRAAGDSAFAASRAATVASRLSEGDASFAANTASFGAFASATAMSRVFDAGIAWEATTEDAQFIEDDGAVAALADWKLWPKAPPAWVYEKWDALEAALPSEQDWEVWFAWYEDRLNGTGRSEERELPYALAPAELWDSEKGWIAANNWIAEHLPPRSPAAKIPTENPIWDFFISYAKEDEAMAREVADVLASAGHTTFAQFKDIPVGSNFVPEMQRGLADSGRVIALYSPHYVRSKHCQAEWNAAYNADPNGEKRKLLPFMVVATPLPPLAMQVVYKSLVGMSREQRRQAILDAIAFDQSRPLELPEETELPGQAPAAMQFNAPLDRPIDVAADPPNEADAANIDQQEHYDEARSKLEALAAVGANMLGDLAKPVARLSEAMPEQMAEAHIVRLWHRANTLREALEAHDAALKAREAVKNPEPDDAILAQSVVRPLRDFVGSYNVFIVGDAKGRELDRLRLGPDERKSGADAIQTIAPVMAAMPNAPEVVTPAASQSVIEQISAAQNAPATPAGDRDVALAKDTSANWLIAITRKARKIIASETGFAWKGTREGAYRAGGAAGGAYVGWQTLKFIADHAPQLKSFADQTLANPAIQQIIDAVVKIMGG